MFDLMRVRGPSGETAQWVGGQRDWGGGGWMWLR
jgi:hypothetical protein